MSLEITLHSNTADEARVIEGTRNFNLLHMPKDVKPLFIFDRLDCGTVIGGLTAKTYWNYLDIEFLWIDDNYRKQGKATAIMQAAEKEALYRGCHYALLDTYSFQALAFYKKLGYTEYGVLEHFTGEHKRHYLQKKLSQAFNPSMSK